MSGKRNGIQCIKFRSVEFNALALVLNVCEILHILLLIHISIMLLDVFGLDSFWDQVLTCWLCMLSFFSWSILNSFKVWAQNPDNPRTAMQNDSQFTSPSHCFICAWDPKACKQSFSNLFAWSDSQRNLQSPSCGNMLITKVSVDVWWYHIFAATNISSNDQIIIQIYNNLHTKNIPRTTLEQHWQTN